MKAGTNMKIAGKTVYVFVLLAITMVTRLAGNEEVSVTVGNSSALNCTLKPKINMITWKIWPKIGGFCTLGYRADTNKTHANCSKRIYWKFRADIDPTLEIWQVGIDQEGNYTCEVASEDGNFDKKYQLTVLVPPRPSLYCDEQGSPVCEAAAGKPPAKLLWVPQSSSTAKEEGHDDGTVTVLSRFTASNSISISSIASNRTNSTTCMVSHPAGNWNQSITCYPSGYGEEEKSNFIWYVCAILCALTIITVIAVIYYFKLPRDRPCHRTEPPEIAPIPSQQDDMTEVEPYTTYVQRENAIYNSVSDLTVGQNLPQDLCPGT